jgi:NitT/TauT family transport system permease protein
MKGRAAGWAELPGVPPLLSLVGLLLLWQLASKLAAIEGLPPATRVLAALPGIVFQRETLVDVGASLQRMAIGFGLAVVVGVPLGLVMGRSQAVAGFFNPLLTTIYPVPKAALMPVIMLWAGVGDASKILVIFLGVSLPLVYHSYQGARAVDEKLVWSAMAMGTGRIARIFRIVLPSALPEVLLGCRVGLAMALIVMVSSEMIARQSGAGNLLFNSLDMAQYDAVYAMIIVISVIGFVLDFAFEKLRRRLTFWSAQRVELAVAES